MDEDLSVSGEGYSAIALLAHFIFGINRGQSYLATLIALQNSQKCLEIFLFLYNLRVLASDQKFFFLLLRATFEQLSLRKATFECFFSRLLSNCCRYYG